MKFAADAAALFILEIEELGGELTDGVLGVFEFGDIGKGRDDAKDGAVWIKLWNRIAEDPEDVGRALTAPTHGATADGALGAQDGLDGTFAEGQELAVLIKREKS